MGDTSFQPAMRRRRMQPCRSGQPTPNISVSN